MKMPRRLNPKLGPISTCITLIVLHFILLEILSRYDIVSSIFAAGDHVPRWMIACTGAFIAIRLAVYLAVPGILVWRITAILLGRIIPHKPERTNDDVRPDSNNSPTDGSATTP